MDVVVAFTERWKSSIKKAQERMSHLKSFHAYMASCGMAFPVDMRVVGDGFSRYLLEIQGISNGQPIRNYCTTIRETLVREGLEKMRPRIPGSVGPEKKGYNEAWLTNNRGYWDEVDSARPVLMGHFKRAPKEAKYVLLFLSNYAARSVTYFGLHPEDISYLSSEVMCISVNRNKTEDNRHPRFVMLSCICNKGKDPTFSNELCVIHSPWKQYAPDLPWTEPIVRRIIRPLGLSYHSFRKTCAMALSAFFATLNLEDKDLVPPVSKKRSFFFLFHVSCPGTTLRPCCMFPDFSNPLTLSSGRPNRRAHLLHLLVEQGLKNV
jgi:hypothetical protein